jgi:hypothetical protein
MLLPGAMLQQWNSMTCSSSSSKPSDISAYPHAQKHRTPSHQALSEDTVTASAIRVPFLSLLF